MRLERRRRSKKVVVEKIEASPKPKGWHSHQPPQYVGRVRCCNGLHAIALTFGGDLAFINHEHLNSELILQAVAEDDSMMRCVKILQTFRELDVASRTTNGELDTALRLASEKSKERRRVKTPVFDPLCGNSRLVAQRHGSDVAAEPRTAGAIGSSALMAKRAATIISRHPTIRSVKRFCRDAGYTAHVHVSALSKDDAWKKFNHKGSSDLNIIMDFTKKTVTLRFDLNPGEWLLDAAGQGQASRYKGLAGLDVLPWHVEAVWADPRQPADEALFSYITSQRIIEKIEDNHYWENRNKPDAVVRGLPTTATEMLHPQVGIARRIGPEKWQYVPIETVSHSQYNY